MDILTPDTPKSEPSVEFLFEPLGIRNPAGILGERSGAVLRCEQITVGGYGAWPREARTTWYYGYMGVPTDVVRANQATVSGRVSWTGQATAARYRESSGHFERALPDGGRAGVDMARVSSSNVDTARRTPSVWVGIEPAKLYTAVGSSNCGRRHRRDIATSIPRTADPVATSRTYSTGKWLCSSSTGHGSKCRTAPAPIWNRSVESLVRAPQGQPTGTPPNASEQGWEA